MQTPNELNLLVYVDLDHNSRVNLCITDSKDITHLLKFIQDNFLECVNRFNNFELVYNEQANSYFVNSLAVYPKLLGGYYTLYPTPTKFNNL